VAHINRLSALKIARTNAPGLYADGAGLYLQVATYAARDGERQSKSWIFRFSRQGRERQMGLGSIDTFNLADARERARECRKLLADGMDPIQHRDAARAAALADAARAMSFRQCAESYIKMHRKGWRNPKHAEQWPSSLGAYAYPVIGDVPVGEVDTAMVVKLLEPIWHAKPETATRVRGRIAKILDWAAAMKHRPAGANPARWVGHLDKLLPKQGAGARVKHHAAMPWADVPMFMAELRASEDVSAQALEFTILTAARTNETIGARVCEFDLTAKLWTVPAERMKAGKDHEVPLSDRALDIVRPWLSGKRKSDFAFPGAITGRGLSDMALLERVRGMRDGITTHGFRSSFRDWAGDATAYPREVVEAALAHTIKSKAERAYRRATALEKRRRLMADWAKFCALPAREGATIHLIGAAR
jgi:integrase